MSTTRLAVCAATCTHTFFGLDWRSGRSPQVYGEKGLSGIGPISGRNGFIANDRCWRKADANSGYHENTGKISGLNANLVPSPCAAAVWSPVFSGRVGWLKAKLIGRPSMTNGMTNLRSLVEKSADPNTLPDICARP
jgi:hypothetical protein